MISRMDPSGPVSCFSGLLSSGASTSAEGSFGVSKRAARYMKTKET